MKARRILFKIDVFFQTILFFGAFSSGVLTAVTGGGTFIFFGLALFFLGAWQLGSGLIMGILLKDLVRIKYFFLSVIYVLFLMGIADYFESQKGIAYSIFLIVFVGIIPMAIAYWYMTWTTRTAQEWKEKLKEINEEDLEDILDSGEFLR